MHVWDDYPHVFLCLTSPRVSLAHASHPIATPAMSHLQPPLRATHAATRPVTTKRAAVTPGASAPDGSRSEAAASTTNATQPSSDSDALVTVTGGATSRDATGAASRVPQPVPTHFAVISLGGTQYKVTIGDIINADYIPDAEVGSSLAVEKVHVIGSVTESVLGRPLVAGARVVCTVEEQTADRKVIVFKKRRRKRYQRTKGHRRLITRLRVEEIVLP